MNTHVNQMNLRLIRNTDPSTAFQIKLMYEDGIIQDYSDDGWVLVNREWYPFATIAERIKNADNQS